MVPGNSGSKIRWKWVRVPVEIWRDIRVQAKREKIAAWKVIQRAWSYWKATQREHHAGAMAVEKKAWYAYKLSASVGEFRGNPTEKNLELLKKTCDQISARLGIDTSKIVLAAEQLMKFNTKKNRMVLNDAAKEVVALIISL